MNPRWFAISLLTTAILALFLAPAFFKKHHQHVALLERLAPRIERAQSLTPETREAIVQLVDFVRNAPAEQRSELRRALVIERVASALKNKDSSQELSSARKRTD
jgi:hypothetical protein